MSIPTFQTPEEILAELGDRLRRHRLNLNLDQKQTAERGGLRRIKQLRVRGLCGKGQGLKPG